MKKLKRICHIVGAILICCSCSEDRIKPDKELNTDPHIEKPNQSPSLFSVQIAEIGKTSAVISWNKAKDSDLDTVYYHVFLEDSLVSSEVNSDTVITIKNLSPFHSYSGHVRATDRKSEPIKVTFSFKTKASVTVFSKLFPNMGGVDLLLADDGGFITGYGLSKFDSLGNVLFSSRIDPPSYGPMYTDLIQSSDKGYLFANRFQIQKFDKDGNHEWTSEGFDEYTVYNSIVELSDGGFIAVGNNVTAGGIIQKFDAMGKKVWIKHFDPAAPSMINCTSVRPSGDGNYIIVGSFGFNNDNEGNPLDILAVSKIDAEGNILWVKNHTIGNYVVTARISKVSDGSFIVGAKTMRYNNAYESWVLNIANDGSIIWEKPFFFGDDTEINSVIELRNGELIFVGSKGYYAKSALLGKLSHSGDLVWRRMYHPNEIDYQWLFWGVQQTNDGGLVLIGGKGYIYNGSERGFWLLKTDSEGNF